MLLVGDVIAGGWNVRLMYWTVLHSLQGSRGHVKSDHFVYPARLVSSDCAMLVVSSQAATSMGCELCASHISLFAFRFRLASGHDSFVFLGTAQPNSSGSLQTLACSLPRFRFSFARSLGSLRHYSS